MKLLIILSAVILTEATFRYKPIIRQCPSGWKRNGGQCYYFCHSLVNQNTAAVSCKAKGGYLVRIDNAGEDEFLQRQAKYLKINANYWISPVCRKQKYEYKCTWQHESNNLPIKYEGWRSGEPNSQQACAVLYFGYGWKWNDYNCYNTAHYICEKPGLVVRPPVVLPAGSSSSGSSSDSSGSSSDSSRSSSDSSGSSSDSSGSSSDSSESKSGSKSKKSKGKKYYKNKGSSSSSSSSESSNHKGYKYGKGNSGSGSGGKSKGGKSKGGKSKGGKSGGKKHYKYKKDYKAGSSSN